MIGHLRDAHSQERPQFLNEHGDWEVVRLFNEPSNDLAATVGIEMQCNDWI